MFASKWTDMVVGLDIHFEMVPVPPAPLPVPMPFPNPFIGIVFDPMGLLIGQAVSAVMAAAFGGAPSGIVLINGLVATNVGTEAMGMGHILFPPGVMWAPMPKFPSPTFRGPPDFPGLPIKPEDDAVAIMGSMTVTVMGSSAVRMGEMWMSCGEPLRSPSSVVIAPPMGPPVLIGGPPAINLLDAIMAMIRTKWVAGYLHSLLSRIKNARVRNVLSFLVCLATGHPVDVMTGRMWTEHKDFELPGPIPLEFTRIYVSSWSHRDGPLGPGWSHSLDQAVWTERGKMVYLAEDGREIEFDVFDFPQHRLSPGQEVYEPMNQLRLRYRALNLIEIETHGGEILEFAPLAMPTGPRSHWWRLQKKRTLDGHEILFVYDKKGNLEWVRDSGGRLVGFEHDADNRLVAVNLPHPSQDAWVRSFQYVYDDEGDLVQATDALGHSFRYAYQRHLMVQETDRNGLSFYFAYDGFNSEAYCVRTWGDGGIYDHLITYAKEAHKTLVENSLGHTTIYQGNALGLVTSVTDPIGGVTTYEYDERTLKKTKEVTPLGAEITWEYDERGNVARTVSETGVATELVHDSRNKPLEIKKATGTWQWKFDQHGNPVESRNPCGEISKYHWHAGLLRTVERANSEQTHLVYDGAKNLSRVEYPDGSAKHFRHDRLGRVTRTTGESGLVTDIEYDAMSRVWRVTQTDGYQVEFGRDGEGRSSWSNVNGQTTRYAYSGFRLAEREEAGSRVCMRYNTEEQLTAFINENGEEWRFELDERGLPRKEWGFDGRGAAYQRGAAGEILKIVAASGATTEHSYDHAARLIATKHSDGTSRSYEYGPDGTPVAAEANGQRVEWTRDALGRVLEERQGVHSVSASYSGGHIQGLVSSLGTEERFTWGARNRLERLVVGGTSPASLIEYGFAPNGAPRRISAPGAVTANWDTDMLGRPERILVASERPRERRYSYAGLRQIRRIVDTQHGPLNLQHDARGRLTGIETADRVQGFRLDGAGNRYGADWQYEAGGRLVRAGDISFSYNEDGYPVEKRYADGRAYHYRWTGGGLLAEVRTPDRRLIRFAYDALARRTSKDVFRIDDDGNEERVARTTYVWNGARLMHEVHSDDRVVTWHWGPTALSPIARSEGARRHTLVHDHIGTPTEMYDEHGKLVCDMQLDANGQASIEGNASLCPWRWPGQYADEETGLSYNWFRYFDPEVGRYISHDPIGIGGASSVYAYVDDPWSQIDFAGLTANHHPIPSQLVKEMENAGHFADNAPGLEGFDNTSRPGLWPLDDTKGAHAHSQAHSALSDYLNDKYKDQGLHMRQGTQHGSDWRAYLENRSNVGEVLDDFDDFYRRWLPEQIEKGEYPLLKGEAERALRSFEGEKERVKGCAK